MRNWSISSVPCAPQLPCEPLRHLRAPVTPAAGAEDLHGALYRVPGGSPCGRMRRVRVATMILLSSARA